MSTELRIVHLFPELLNLYADQGNIAVLKLRAERRGLSVTVKSVRLGESLNFDEADLLLLGGGSDREQAVVGKELLRYRTDLVAAVEHGLPLLAVCGGYQLLGRYYDLDNGERISGLSLVDMVTHAGRTRLIGNIAVSWNHDEVINDSVAKTIVGFENHAGRTEHDHNSLGRVLSGHGNNGRDGQEGLQYKGIIGTYIHGPLLPKNPHLADHLLQLAMAYRGTPLDLHPLDDLLEWKAHQFVLGMMGVL